MFWIALAGPASNIFLACVGALLIAVIAKFFLSFGFASALIEILKVFIITNLFLAFFNLIPLHPLDGGKIMARFLSPQLNYKLEQNEHVTSMILMALVLTGVLRFLSIPVFWSANHLIGIAIGGFGL
jgi:Zn-dependent protease